MLLWHPETWGKHCHLISHGIFLFFILPITFAACRFDNRFSNNCNSSFSLLQTRRSDKFEFGVSTHFFSPSISPFVPVTILSPFSSSLYPSLFPYPLFLSFLSSQALPFRSRTPKIQLEGLGEHCEPLRRGLRRSTSWNWIWCITALKYEIWWRSGFYPYTWWRSLCPVKNGGECWWGCRSKLSPYISLGKLYPYQNFSPFFTSFPPIFHSAPLTKLFPLVYFPNFALGKLHP